MKKLSLYLATALLFVLPATGQELLPKDVALQTVDELTVHLAELQQAQGSFSAAANSALGSAVKVSQAAGAVADLAAKDTRLGLELRAQIKQMQEMNMSFNMQYLQLQQKMQDESRRFTLISNIMKTKHDTAKNSISNIR